MSESVTPSRSSRSSMFFGLTRLCEPAFSAFRHAVTFVTFGSAFATVRISGTPKRDERDMRVKENSVPIFFDNWKIFGRAFSLSASRAHITFVTLGSGL